MSSVVVEIPPSDSFFRYDSLDSSHTSTEAELSPENSARDKPLSLNENSDYSILDGTTSAAVTSQDTIKVLCRFRPEKKASMSSSSPTSSLRLSKDSRNHGTQLTPADIFNIFGDSKIVEVTSDRKTVNDSIEKRKYVFDKIFGPDTTQEEVFGEVEDVVDSVMAGFNGAIMAYGQTAAGKSYTMEGPSLFDKSSQGIISRSVDKLFNMINKANDNLQFQIIASYLEVYCEKLRDLLDPQQFNMKIRESKTEGFLVHDLTEAICKDKDSVFRLIEQGKANRASAPTLMNAESSRSHSILSISVIQKNLDTGRKKKARLFLVDLAGSEKVSKSGATGTRLEEAKNINMSLTTLGMVINALCEGLPHVPFRDSKLTKVLMDTLGGNSKTVLIICCSPEPQHLPETISTLRFGERAKKVRNSAIVNEEISVEELKSMLEAAKREILYLRAKIAALESGKSVQVDPLRPSVDQTIDLMAVDTEERNILPKRSLNRHLSVKSLEIAATVEDLLNQTDNVWKLDLHEPLAQASEKIASLESQVSLHLDEIEAERRRYEQERDWRLLLESEVSVLKGVVRDLEARLLRLSRGSQMMSRQLSRQLSPSEFNSSFDDTDGDDLDNRPSMLKFPKKSPSVSSSWSSPRVRQDREEEQLYSLSKLYDMMEELLLSLKEKDAQLSSNDSPSVTGLNAAEQLIADSAASLEKYEVIKHNFEQHIEKLRGRLAEEHELRLNAEMEMENALLKLDKMNGGRRSMPPSQQSMSGDFFSFFSNSLGLGSPFGFSNNHNHIMLALEESQMKVKELVTELETTKEAHAIAAETREGILRQLMRQNTQLTIDKEDLNKQIEQLVQRNDQLTTLLQSFRGRIYTPVQYINVEPADNSEEEEPE